MNQAQVETKGISQQSKPAQITLFRKRNRKQTESDRATERERERENLRSCRRSSDDEISDGWRARET